MKTIHQSLFCPVCFKDTVHKSTNFQTMIGRMLGKFFLFFHDDTYHECTVCKKVSTEDYL